MASQREKCRYFREYGVDVCWLVDPVSRTVEVFEDGRDGDVLHKGDTLTSQHLTGFSLPLADLSPSSAEPYCSGEYGSGFR